MKVVFDRISLSGFGAASLSLPTMDVTNTNTNIFISRHTNIDIQRAK